TLEPLTLKMNFRSAAGLAAWVNGAFPAIMPPSEDAGSGAVPFARAIPYHGAQVDPAVVVHPMLQGEEGDRAALDAAEAQQVAAIVTEVRAARPDDTVAVLVRSRAHLQAIAPALQRQGLSYRAVEIEALAGRQIVQDLLTLTRALLHPADRIAWLALLRAPWCGLTLADLLHLAAAPECTLWERMVDAEVVAGLSADGQARLARVVDVMRRSAVQRARKPLRRWVEGAWLALGAPACFPASELADARAFLELLEGMESRREPLTVERLTERLEGLFATPDALADERLQLMSMHKAKGLEFDTVILPGLGKRLRADDPPLLRWFERPTAAADEGLLLAPIHEAGSDGDAIYRYLAGLEKEKAAHETGRLLYVAATRARRQLHLLGHARLRDGALQIPPSGSLLRRLWEVVQPEFQRGAEPANDAPPTGAAADGGREAPSSPLMRRLVSGWRLPDAPPDVPLPGRDAPPAEDLGRAEAPEFSWAGATARQVGTVVHRLLRIIARHGAERLGSEDAASLGSGAIRAALAGLGVAPEALEDAASRVEEALRRTLADPRGLWALRPHAEARSEYAVTAMVDGRPSRFVVDRTFVDEGGTRWIIDFKTGSHEGGALEAFLEREQARYRPQLENYAAVMAQLDPARPIRVGLYFPLLTAWREWTPGH
ncbi:MAG: PD-(D/E)XK nuclease family protein, partial [SAR324 cluster bacterium]|nr:PD-(D/E)XK nuclease family protein [SAR324 cluster bacterium]